MKRGGQGYGLATARATDIQRLWGVRRTLSG